MSEGFRAVWISEGWRVMRPDGSITPTSYGPNLAECRDAARRLNESAGLAPTTFIPQGQMSRDYAGN